MDDFCFWKIYFVFYICEVFFIIMVKRQMIPFILANDKLRSDLGYRHAFCLFRYIIFIFSVVSIEANARTTLK